MGLIVKMHQKLQDIDKENEAKKEIPAVKVEEIKDNPKPLGLKAVAAAAAVESVPFDVKPVEGVKAKLPLEGAVETGNGKKTVGNQIAGVEPKQAKDGKPSEEGDL